MDKSEKGLWNDVELAAGGVASMCERTITPPLSSTTIFEKICKSKMTFNNHNKCLHINLTFIK
jgi:hypothetical protein